MREVDVVVAGSGGAGLTAAVVAGLKGLDVLVLEKDEVFGGTTAISGGGAWIPGNAAGRRQGVPDSAAEARTYLQHMLGNRFDAARVDSFLENGPKMVDFLEANGVIRFFTTTDRPDYYPGEPGAGQGGRCIFPVALDARVLGSEVRRLRRPLREAMFLGMPIKPGPDLHHFFNVFRSAQSFRFVARRLVRHARDVAVHGRSMDLGSGNALIAYLAKAAFGMGIPILTEAAVDKLVFTGSRVSGVRYRTPDGLQEVCVRRGVVLATGGFPQDVARRKTLYPHAPTGAEHRSPAPATNTGDGIRIAERSGATVPELLDAAAWAPVSVVPYADGSTGTFPHLIDRQKPGFIAVTRHGQRFVNESHSYHEFCRGLALACTGEPEAYCFLIADHKTIRRYGIGFAKPAPVPLRPYLRSGYLIRGGTLRQLAENAGIVPDAFEHTVRTFNQHARRGEDPEFGRGTSAYQRYNGDPLHKPNPCVAPIEHAPFYAVRVVMGELGTFAGVATDARARVLGTEGRPIDGLYAVGNDMSHITGGNYLAGGTTLGPGMTFGYIAACDLAGADPSSTNPAASSNTA